jgi:maltose alpha-D-glucosyltransferase/alpha-amylase
MATRRWLVLQVEFAVGDPEVYVLPVTYAVGAAAETILHDQPAAAIARINDSRGGEGLLYDAMAGKALARALLDAVGESATFRGANGTLVARATGAFEALRGSSDISFEPTLAHADHSNTASDIW